MINSWSRYKQEKENLVGCVQTTIHRRTAISEGILYLNILQSSGDSTMTKILLSLQISQIWPLNIRGCWFVNNQMVTWLSYINSCNFYKYYYLQSEYYFWQSEYYFWQSGNVDARGHPPWTSGEHSGHSCSSLPWSRYEGLFFLFLFLVLVLVLILVLVLHSPEVDMKVCSIFHNRPFWCSSVIHDIKQHEVGSSNTLHTIQKFRTSFVMRSLGGESLRTPKVVW